MTFSAKYRGLTEPFSLGGRNLAYMYNKGKKADIDKQLAGINSYYFHREAKRPRVWNPIYVYNRREILQADLIDLRSLQPLDTETIYNSARKTGKVIILQEDSLFGGIASDLSAMIMEHCFEHLDAPVKRVASMETPIPFVNQLEEQYLAKGQFEEVLIELLAY